MRFRLALPPDHGQSEDALQMLVICHDIGEHLLLAGNGLAAYQIAHGAKHQHHLSQGCHGRLHFGCSMRTGF